MEDKLPEYLYKYRPWVDNKDKDNKCRRILTHNEIFFSSARHFNDPFDCRIPMRYDLNSDEENRKTIKKRILEDNPNISIELLEEQVDDWFTRKEWIKPENEERYQELKYRTFGIFSVSSVADNILMWSHYADSHKGFCIGLNTQALDEFTKRRAKEFGDLIYPIKVLYTTEYPRLVPSDFDDDVKYGEIQLKYKSELWSYEKEYRYIHIGVSDITFNDDGIIERIILGCEMPDKHKEEIIQTVNNQNSNINIYEARKKKDEFGLDIVEINY